MHPNNLAHDFIFVQRSIQMELDEEAKTKELAAQKKIVEMRKTQTDKKKTTEGMTKTQTQTEQKKT